MEGNRSGEFRRKWLNKKVLLIAIGVVVVLGVGGGVAFVKASDNPAFCNICHIMQPYYNSWHESGLLANKHAAAGVTCHDCHESSLTIQAEEGFKFVTGDYKTPLDKLEVSQDFCLKCHSDSGTGTLKGESFEAAKSKTNFQESNPHDPHNNGEQECNLCHNVHQQSELICADCHSFTWFNQLDNSWTKK